VRRPGPTSVIVAIPARNEARHVRGCLHSIARAAAAVRGSAGAARAAALERGLDLTGGRRSPQDLWIATTDADSEVSPTWLSRQLDYAAIGFDAVAGVIELLDDEDRLPSVFESFEQTYRFTSDTAHAHVHGANLGVRGDAYLAVGGFPQLALAEDHALWERLGAHGCRRVSPIDVVVATSARLRGRAPGGFADTLASIQPEPIG
jgi:hypothetical protein